ncbi:MAG: DUF1854 domain-containing protein [Clostridia bacterium]|nr:DUF1854 domain-containing protein [Clostridia bacterium]
MSDNRTSLRDVVSIVYITPENAAFGETNHFLTLTMKTRDENGADTEKSYDRVFLHRAFPFDHPESYISVQDADKNELGMIAELSVFPAETADLLRAELERKYYAPVLKSIVNIRDRYGYAYCTAVTDSGEITFTLRDASRSIFRADEKRVIITDIDGNRFDIPDLTKLDRKSFKKIELYL